MNHLFGLVAALRVFVVVTVTFSSLTLLQSGGPAADKTGNVERALAA